MKSIIIYALLLFCPGSKMIINSQSAPGADCELALRHLSNIWKQENGLCPDARTLVANEIVDVINKDGCLKGKHVSKIIKYLGKPNIIGADRIIYDIFDKSREHGPIGSAPATLSIVYTKDSSIIGAAIGEVDWTF